MRFSPFKYARQAGALPDPTALTNLLHWWRADQGLTLSGSNVTQWTDIVNAKVLAQGNASRQPLLIASDPNFNGQPTLDYVNVFTNLQVLPGISVSAGESVTFLAIFKAASGAATKPVLQQGWWGDTEILGIGVGGTSSGTVYGTTLNQNGMIAYLHTSQYPGTQYGTNALVPHMFGVTYDGTAPAANVIYNNTFYTPIGTVNPNQVMNNTRKLITGSGTINSGQNQLGGIFIGQLAELIITKGYIDSAQLTIMVNYINQRYGI